MALFAFRFILYSQEPAKVPFEIYVIIISKQDKCVKMHNSVLPKMQRG